MFDLPLGPEGAEGGDGGGGGGGAFPMMMPGDVEEEEFDLGEFDEWGMQGGFGFGGFDLPGGECFLFTCFIYFVRSLFLTSLPLLQNAIFSVSLCLCFCSSSWPSSSLYFPSFPSFRFSLSDPTSNAR
jgi:hypothetical protein